MYICILSLMPIEQTLKTWLSAKLWTASHQLLHEKPHTKLLHVLSAFRLSLLLLHSALLPAPCSHQEQHPPQASPADVQSLFVLSNPDFRPTSAQQHVWDSCWTGSDGLHLKPKFETQRKKCTSKSKQTHPVRFLSVRIIISIDRLFNIFFQGEVLWLLPTNTARHLCQPNSPPACPQLFSLFLAGSWSLSLDFLY